MKKTISLLLALCMVLSVSVSAFGAQSASLSRQTVRVDGVSAACAAYNIGGSNYFKLRDIAMLLRTTDAEFSVDFNSRAMTVSVVTGAAYSPVGGELGSAASVASRTASSWKLLVDGKAVSCEVYNIGGNNYFKIRDLGGAIGFGVDYDKSADAVLITTSGSSYSPDISFSTTDTAGKTWTDACFKTHKLTMINLWSYWCGPCCSELPELQKLSENYSSRGLQVLGLVIGADADSDAAKMKELGITYPSLIYTPAFGTYINTGYYPNTIFVDQNGKVLGSAYAGARSYNQWSSIVEDLMA